MGIFENMRLATRQTKQAVQSAAATMKGDYRMQQEIIAGQRTEVAEAIASIEVRRAAAALDSIGDAGDQRSLTDLNKELMRLKQRDSDLEAAFKEAQRRENEEAAKARALSEAERKAKLAEAYKRYQSATGRIDQAVTDLAVLGNDLTDAIADMHALTGDYQLFLGTTEVIGAIPAITAHRCRKIGFKHPAPLTFVHDDPREKLSHYLVSRRELGLED